MDTRKRVATIKDGELGACILRLSYHGDTEAAALVEYVGPGAAQRAWLEAARWRSLGLVHCYGGTTIWHRLLHSAAGVAAAGQQCIVLSEGGSQ